MIRNHMTKLVTSESGGDYSTGALTPAPEKPAESHHYTPFFYPLDSAKTKATLYLTY